jgi:hypothetical protein
VWEIVDRCKYLDQNIYREIGNRNSFFTGARPVTHNNPVWGEYFKVVVVFDSGPVNFTGPVFQGEKLKKWIIIDTVMLIIVIILAGMILKKLYEPIHVLPKTEPYTITIINNYTQGDKMLNKRGYVDGLDPEDPDLYTLIQERTGTPNWLLYGTRMAESGGKDNAVGDDGISIGSMQLNEQYRSDRVKLCGYEYDPHDTYDALYVAALIYKQNVKVYGVNVRQLIASYRQGVTGVNKNGITSESYVDRVIFYAEKYKIEGCRHD